MSLPKIFIIIEVGVTTKKKTNPITIGEIKFPRIIPNLNQALFRGVKIFDLIKPKIRNIKLIMSAHILIPLPSNIGNKEVIKKTIKKTIPKLLLELIFILFLFK